MEQSMETPSVRPIQLPLEKEKLDYPSEKQEETKTATVQSNEHVAVSPFLYGKKIKRVLLFLEDGTFEDAHGDEFLARIVPVDLLGEGQDARADILFADKDHRKILV